MLSGPAAGCQCAATVLCCRLVSTLISWPRAPDEGSEGPHAPSLCPGTERCPRQDERPRLLQKASLLLRQSACCPAVPALLTVLQAC